jgi:hypothetical protein
MQVISSQSVVIGPSRANWASSISGQGCREDSGGEMEAFAEFVSVIGALVLSVSCGLLLEELLFGGLTRLFIARRPDARSEKERNQKGERPCLR